MSTNNGKTTNAFEVKPVFLQGQEPKVLRKLSCLRLQERMSNQLSECTAMALCGREIEQIVDLVGLGGKLRRLDLSSNKLTRLAHFEAFASLSLLNVSDNAFAGDAGLEELRYLRELRTLNLTGNRNVVAIRSHVVKPLEKLQALIASSCGLEKASFLKFLPQLNTIVLSKNELVDFATKDVGDLSNVVKISIGHNRLSRLPDLRNCGLLQELRLNYNCISEVPEGIVSFNKNIKTLDLSHNQISSWSCVELLARLPHLTNLCLKGNPLPSPPESTSAVQLKEDVASERDLIVDEEEKRYRHAVLSIFQHPVGKLGKPFVQLIVLDNKRVKVKWSQGKASSSSSSSFATLPLASSISEKKKKAEIATGAEEKKKKKNKKRSRAHEEEHEEAGHDAISEALSKKKPAQEEEKEVLDEESKKKKKRKNKERSSEHELEHFDSVEATKLAQVSALESGVVEVKQQQKKKREAKKEEDEEALVNKLLYQPKAAIGTGGSSAW